MSSSVSKRRGASRAAAACATCARRARAFTGHYRAFLLEPGTVFTVAAALLLGAAIVVDPAGSVSSSGAHSWLYVLAALVGSVYIWFSAVQGIRERDFTADIPVSLATISAIAIGQFSAAAVVAVLLLVGGLLEEFVAARAGRALDSLKTLLPDVVTVRGENGEALVALAEVRVGDVVLVRPGERIAVDGQIRSGVGSVEEAAITGESVPIDKGRGDEVFAGTLNCLGALEIVASGVGEETTLGQIRRLVEEAQEQKAPIERVLDRYALLYTPTAIVLAVALWALTGDPLRAITVLIVFCPCVMVLATPTALVASIGNAALRGSLIKQGATVEAAASVDTVLFDKTGTLTLGHPRLVATVPLNGLAADQLLTLAATAEKFSEHPLGRALVRAAGERDCRVEDPLEFEALPGLGVRALAGGRRVLVGRTSAWEGVNRMTGSGRRSLITPAMARAWSRSLLISSRRGCSCSRTNCARGRTRPGPGCAGSGSPSRSSAAIGARPPSGSPRSWRLTTCRRRCCPTRRPRSSSSSGSRVTGSRPSATGSTTVPRSRPDVGVAMA